MVQPVTNEQQAQHTAEVIRRFRERRRLVELEQVCLGALIEELTTELLRYRQASQRNGDTDDV